MHLILISSPSDLICLAISQTYTDVAADEFALQEKELEREYLDSQKRIIEFEEEQRTFLENLRREQQSLDAAKRGKAALQIQVYRHCIAVVK